MIKYCSLGGYAPERAHEWDAGADLRTPQAVLLPAGESVNIDTKLCVEIPQGYFGKLESKSGLNVKHKIVCPGGVIDSGYAGSIVVRLENHGDTDYLFRAGDKICQLVIIPCLCEGFDSADKVAAGDRGTDGFGSTGR